LSDTAYAHVYANSDAAYNRVRLFRRSKDDSNATSWDIVDKEFSFSAKQLREGLHLGLDGRELATNSKIWNGDVVLQFDVFDEGAQASDTVALRLAPVLTHNHLQKVDTLISVAANNTSPTQEQFIQALEDARQAANIERPLLLLNQSDDIWAQDFIEPGFASMPGPDGPVSIRIILRSAQSTRTAGRQVFEQLRGEGIGGFQPTVGFGHREINSFGNLETIPPYTSKSGQKYTAGRIIMGKHFDELPAQPMLDFLEAQKLQKPLILETGWLAIGHVDEFVQFLPYNNSLGWTIAIADTTTGFATLKDIEAMGHGGTLASSFKPSSGDESSLDFFGPSDANQTVTSLLRDQAFLDANEYAQRHIDSNLQVLLQEIDLAESDIIRVPALFKESGFGGSPNSTFSGPTGGTDDGLPSHISPLYAGEKQLAAFAPAAINGIVVGKHYLSPKPWGPVVNGADVIEESVKVAYRRAGMSVTFIDDYMSHHVGGGEIHCGSNTLRDTDLKWWE
jgi:protein-arginine deiminase